MGNIYIFFFYRMPSNDDGARQTSERKNIDFEEWWRRQWFATLDCSKNLQQKIRPAKKNILRKPMKMS